SGGCLSKNSLPIGLTNNASDRTAETLASTFEITSPSLISPTALAALNAQLPDGQFVIPAPQSPNGTTSFSSPYPYDDNQFVTNLDSNKNNKSHFAGMFFFMDSDQTSASPKNSVGTTAVTVPGFPQAINNRFRDFSLTHTLTFNN